jgi:hypothetical protein
MTAAIEDAELDSLALCDLREEIGAFRFGRPNLQVRGPRTAERSTAE